MKQRGQLQISFGMMFSIIIIIATLAVAAYVLVKFANLGSTVSCDLLVQELQQSIDKAWAADGGTSATFTHRVPKNTQAVCFGNTTLIANPADRAKQEDLSFYVENDRNFFFYPPVQDLCGTQTIAFQLRHVLLSRFFCIPVEDGKMKVHYTKTSAEALVTLRP